MERLKHTSRSYEEMQTGVSCMNNVAHLARKRQIVMVPNTSGGGLFVLHGIIREVVGVSALALFMRYIPN